MVVVSFCAGLGLSGLITASVCTSCGKPSTWFPHGGLVECLLIKKMKFSKKMKNFEKILTFFKFLNFSKISKNLIYHGPCRGIYIFIFY